MTADVSIEDEVSRFLAQSCQHCLLISVKTNISTKLWQVYDSGVK